MDTPNENWTYWVVTCGSYTSTFTARSADEAISVAKEIVVDEGGALPEGEWKAVPKAG